MLIKKGELDVLEISDWALQETRPEVTLRISAQIIEIEGKGGAVEDPRLTCGVVAPSCTITKDTSSNKYMMISFKGCRIQHLQWW